MKMNSEHFSIERLAIVIQKETGQSISLKKIFNSDGVTASKDDLLIVIKSLKDFGEGNKLRG